MIKRFSYTARSRESAEGTKTSGAHTTGFPAANILTAD